MDESGPTSPQNIITVRSPYLIRVQPETGELILDWSYCKPRSPSVSPISKRPKTAINVGFISCIGEPGCGKTTLLFRIFRHLRKFKSIAYPEGVTSDTSGIILTAAPAMVSLPASYGTSNTDLFCLDLNCYPKDKRHFGKLVQFCTTVSSFVMFVVETSSVDEIAKAFRSYRSTKDINAAALLIFKSWPTQRCDDGSNFPPNVMDATDFLASANYLDPETNLAASFVDQVLGTFSQVYVCFPRSPSLDDVDLVCGSRTGKWNHYIQMPFSWGRETANYETVQSMLYDALMHVTGLATKSKMRAAYSETDISRKRYLEDMLGMGNLGSKSLEALRSSEMFGSVEEEKLDESESPGQGQEIAQPLEAEEVLSSDAEVDEVFKQLLEPLREPANFEAGSHEVLLSTSPPPKAYELSEYSEDSEGSTYEVPLPSPPLPSAPGVTKVAEPTTDALNAEILKIQLKALDFMTQFKLHGVHLTLEETEFWASEALESLQNPFLFTTVIQQFCTDMYHLLSSLCRLQQRISNVFVHPLNQARVHEIESEVLSITKDLQEPQSPRSQTFRTPLDQLLAGGLHLFFNNLKEQNQLRIALEQHEFHQTFEVCLKAYDQTMSEAVSNFSFTNKALVGLHATVVSAIFRFVEATKTTSAFTWTSFRSHLRPKLDLLFEKARKYNTSKVSKLELKRKSILQACINAYVQTSAHSGDPNEVNEDFVHEMFDSVTSGEDEHVVRLWRTELEAIMANPEFQERRLVRSSSRASEVEKVVKHKANEGDLESVMDRLHEALLEREDNIPDAVHKFSRSMLQEAHELLHKAVVVDFHIQNAVQQLRIIAHRIETEFETAQS